MNRKISLDLLGYALIPSQLNDSQDAEDNNRQLRQLKHTIRLVIDSRLTSRQREILVLYFFENKKIPEISKILKVNKSTVSRTLNRAIKNLRQYLEFYTLR